MFFVGPVCDSLELPFQVSKTYGKHSVVRLTVDDYFRQTGGHLAAVVLLQIGFGGVCSLTVE